MENEASQVLEQIGAPLIAVVVPIIVALVKKIVPRVPKALLPILAGAFGPAVEALLAQLGALEFTGTLGVAMGIAGIGLRELKDQVLPVLTTGRQKPAPAPVEPGRDGR